MPTPPATAVVQSGDVRLFMRRFGTPNDRMPLLVLHGANYYDSADWIEVGERLGQDREVITFDLRGFGNSSWSASKDYGPAAAVSDVRAVLAHARWQRAVLLGHSRGGSQALLAAARLPQRVSGLVLADYNPGRGFGPPGGVVPPASQLGAVFPTIEAALAATTRFRSEPLTHGMRIRAQEFLQPVEGGWQLSRRDPSFLHQPADALGAFGLRGGYEELADTRCPVLVLRARQAATFEPADLLRLGAIDRLQIRGIDAGHDLVGEAAAAFVTELNDWLQVTFAEP